MDLEESLNQYFDYNISRIFTCLPAKVIGVDLRLQRVDVLPALRRKYKDEEDQDFSQILGVPLVFPSSSTSAFTFKVSVGDTVMLVFAQRSLDSFKAGSGDVSSPSDFRDFDIRDAIAIPGLFPFRNAVNNPALRNLPHNTDDAVLVHNIGTGSETEVRLKSSGEISLKSPVKVLIDSPQAEFTGNVLVQNTLTAVTDVIGGGKSLKTHTHGGVQPGGGNTTPPN